MTTRNTVRKAATLSALALTITGAGCGLGDWLDPSGTSSRVSPVISALSVRPQSVFCDRPITISFDFTDPQNDVQQLLLAFVHAGTDERLDRSVFWDDPALEVAGGRATYAEFAFECGGPSAGDWEVRVQLEDEQGHLSNELTADITLVSAR